MGGLLIAATGCASASDVTVVTSVNVLLAPDDAVALTTEAIKANPSHAADITTAAVTSSPRQAAAITQAAYAAAPDQRDAIDRALARRSAAVEVALPPAAMPQGVMAQAPFTIPFRTQSRVQFMSGSLLSRSGAY
jgi:hypothetical protein